MADPARKLAAQNLHVADLPYRLNSWTMDSAGNIRLWVDEEQQPSQRFTMALSL